MIKKQNKTKYLSIISTIVSPSASSVGVPNTSVGQILLNFVRWSIYAIGLLGVIMFIVAGYFFLTAGGDANKIQTAKKVAIYAVVGLAVSILGLVAVTTIDSIIGSGSSASSSSSSDYNTFSDVPLESGSNEENNLQGSNRRERIQLSEIDSDIPLPSSDPDQRGVIQSINGNTLAISSFTKPQNPPNGDLSEDEMRQRINSMTEEEREQMMENMPKPEEGEGIRGQDSQTVNINLSSETKIILISGEDRDSIAAKEISINDLEAEDNVQIWLNGEIAETIVVTSRFY